MKVLFITNIPSPYNVAFLDELGKRADVVAVFEKASSSERDASWTNAAFSHFRGVMLRGITVDVDKAFCPGIIKHIRDNQDRHIIIGNPLTPTGMTAICYCKLNKIPFILQSEGGIPKDGRGFKEKLKRLIMSGAQLYFSGMSKGHEYFLMYGATPEKVVQYPFTSLSQEDLSVDIASREEKARLRQKLNMAEDKCVLSVGQFIHRKGFDILLRACGDMDKRIGIYIIGGKPTEEYLHLQKEYGLTNVHFLEFMNEKALGEYYRAADLFVLPTREDTWGLVINEAMAKALPVITTGRCVAGVELVENGINGYVVPVEDIAQLRSRMEEILGDTTLRDSMAKESLKKIQWYTYENMAINHIRVLGSLHGSVPTHGKAAEKDGAPADI